MKRSITLLAFAVVVIGCNPKQEEPKVQYPHRSGDPGVAFDEFSIGRFSLLSSETAQTNKIILRLDTQTGAAWILSHTTNGSKWIAVSEANK